MKKEISTLKAIGYIAAAIIVPAEIYIAMLLFAAYAA